MHVGCGTGYYTAVLAEIVGPTGRVVAVEIDPQLAQRSRLNLGYLHHVLVYEGNGCEVDLGGVDAIFVNAGASQPQAIWLDALRMGGRLLLPITVAAGRDTGIGGMFLITRRPEGFPQRRSRRSRSSPALVPATRRLMSNCREDSVRNRESNPFVGMPTNETRRAGFTRQAAACPRAR